MKTYLTLFFAMVLLTACGAGGSKKDNDDTDRRALDFYARTIAPPTGDVSADLQARLTDDASATALNGVGRDYLATINFEAQFGYDSDEDGDYSLETFFLRGDGAGLAASNGFLMAVTSEADMDEANIVVALFDGADVGADFDGATTATFRGDYLVRLIATRPANPPLDSITGRGTIDLRIDFSNNRGTIDGEADVNSTTILTVDGRFFAGEITGNVTLASPYTDIGGTQRAGEYTASLDGLIGQDGAVGIFAGTDNGNSYVLGGGFVVQPTQ